MSVALAFLMSFGQLFYDCGQKQRKQSDRKNLTFQINRYSAEYSSVNFSGWNTTLTHVEGRENLQRLGNNH